MIAPDGSAVMCMRTASDKPKQLSSGDVGYIHSTNTNFPKVQVREKKREVVINVGRLMDEWWNEQRRDIAELAASLNVATWALGRLGVTWSPPYYAWAIPFRDGYNNFTGIQLRYPNGKKLCVEGSHLGCFIPQQEPDPVALIVEGASDTAAALTLGYFAIGRPSCSGGLPHIQAAVRRLRVRRAVIVSDNDGPGMAGAKNLAQHLMIPSCVLALPCKDVRQYVQLGGTRELLDNMIEQAVWSTK